MTTRGVLIASDTTFGLQERSAPVRERALQKRDMKKGCR